MLSRPRYRRRQRAGNSVTTGATADHRDGARGYVGAAREVERPQCSEARIMHGAGMTAITYASPPRPAAVLVTD